MSSFPADWNPDEFTERIVREVIRRLLAMEAQQGGAHQLAGSNRSTAPVVRPPHPLQDKLITAATLESVPAGTSEVLIPARAVVTPLARDEAKAKGLRLTRVKPDGSPMEAQR